HCTDLRRRLREEYGTGPATVMLIDRAVSAYQDFVRVTGRIGNLSIHIERELFGADAPRADFQGRTIRGLTVEQYLTHLTEGLLPFVSLIGMRARLDGARSWEAMRSSAPAWSKVSPRAGQAETGSRHHRSGGAVTTELLYPN